MKPIYREFEKNYKTIKDTYDILNTSQELKITIHSAGEWILDNMYIIEQEYISMKDTFKEVKCNRLPNAKTTGNGDTPRILYIANQIVENYKGAVDQYIVANFIDEFQKTTYITFREFELFPFMIRLALIKFISRICAHIYYCQLQKMKVEKVINKTVENNNALEKYADKIKSDLLDINSIKTTNTAYVEYMSYRLKMLGKQGDEYYNKLRIEVDKAGFSIEEAIEKQHSEIAKTRHYIGSAIISLKQAATTNWSKIFEEINKIDEILRTDYTLQYDKMDYKTKDMYRTVVIKMAKKLKLSEMYIAKKAIECSKEYKKHVGFFLIGEDTNILKKKLGCYDSGREFDVRMWEKAKPELYIIIILLITSISTVILNYTLFSALNIWARIIFDICSFFILLEVAGRLVDYILQKIVKPKILPRMSYEIKEVEDDNATLVAMPTIISSKVKIDEMVEKMEITYLSNKTRNLFFMLLGDCTSEQEIVTKLDEELFVYGRNKIEQLNSKYSYKNSKPIFNLLYRKRVYNKSEGCYMGWERKRGAITHLNKLLLGKLSEEEIHKYMYLAHSELPKVKYILTIDEDTVLPLNSAKDLIGIMSHPINKPVLSENGKIVERGHGIVQPNVGLDIEAANKSIFSRLFGGFGGIDIYTNAISNVYQDCFGEAIFAGKGIYDLECFENVLDGQIPENTVLSHDLLEGSYLRTGLASDIEVQDGFPYNFISYTTRNHRWIRGDFQIMSWLRTNSPLNLLSQWKIFDNLRRATLDIFILIYLVIAAFCPCTPFIIAVIVTFVVENIGVIIAGFDALILGKNDYIKQKQYIPVIYGFKANILKMLFNYITIPYNAFMNLDAIIRTLYRMIISKKHKLEWTTGATLDKMVKDKPRFLYQKMWFNIVVSIAFVIFAFTVAKEDMISLLILSVLFIIGPYIAYIFSKTTSIIKEEDISRKDKELLLDIARRTWKFFDALMIEAYNYLPSDNYQDNRIPKIVPRTSSTNIGFGLMAIIDAYDLKFIELDDCMTRLYKILMTIEKLPKWHGHLYNWYNIKTLETLSPKFVSTVDSGNFVTILLVAKRFFLQIKTIKEYEKKADMLLEIVERMAVQTDFTKLYNNSANLFTVGYDVENDKYVDSNYDILVSEARQTSLVAISLGQISPKHWFVMSRNLVTMDNYKGLSSWSGTTFEYFMPLLFIKSYKYTLLDEALFFAAYSQKKYGAMHGVPFGISEASYAKQDVDLNYQYKAFGIPWLGVKRGLNDDLVVSPYSTFLMLTSMPKDAMKNIYKLMDLKAYSTFGFYESIDFTKKHIDENSRYGLVKTYMAHHQGMTLTAINNYLNNNIVQERFHDNLEIKSTEILLKERTPLKVAIREKTTDKENKFKQKEIKRYTTHVDFSRKIDLEKPVINLLTNGKLSTTILDNGANYMKYKEKCINKGRYTDIKTSGNFLMFKDMDTNECFSSSNYPIYKKPDDFFVDYTLDNATYFRLDGDIETTTTISIATESDIEIRKVVLVNRNDSKAKEIMVSSYMELSMTDYMSSVVHPAFSNLQIETFFDEDLDTLVAKKRTKVDTDDKMYVYSKLVGIDEKVEYETEKTKINTSEAYDNNIARYPLWPVLSSRTIIKLKPSERKKFYYIVGVADNRYDISHTIASFGKYYLEDITKLAGEKAQVISRYLRLHDGEAGQYNRIISQALFNKKDLKSSEYWDVNLSQSMLWKFSISGDLPIVLIKTDALEDAIIIKDVIKFMDYAKQKKFDIDVIMLVNEDLNKGEPISNYLIEMQRNVSYMSYTKGHIYTLNANKLNIDERKLFNLVASVTIDSKYASFEGIKKMMSSN